MQMFGPAMTRCRLHSYRFLAGSDMARVCLSRRPVSSHVIVVAALIACTALCENFLAHNNT